MQGFLARGQFLDRAIRVPFDIFGGVTRDGNGSPAPSCSTRRANIITGAKFSVEGRFAFLNPFMETARAGLVDRYGLDPKYVERERGKALDERAVMLQGAEVLKSLKDTTSARPRPACCRRSSPARTWRRDMAQAGRADPRRDRPARAGGGRARARQRESFERNRGTYLHRVYKKYEAEQNGLVRMVNNIMGSRRKKIIGDQFKRRGMFQEVALSRLMRDVPAWHEGAAASRRTARSSSASTRCPTRRSSSSTTTRPRREAAAHRVLARRPGHPRSLFGFTNQGTWEVRGRRAASSSSGATSPRPSARRWAKSSTPATPSARPSC
jgi:hypothetical protein